MRETGSGDGEGTTINVPLPAGSGDAALCEAFESILVPAAQRFDPGFIVVSAGFDAHCLDPVGGMQVTTDGFATLMRIVDQLTSTLADGRISLVLEGGYHLDALARSVTRCIEVLAMPPTEKFPSLSSKPYAPAMKLVERARRFHF